jgi:hypothetical protein
MHCEMGIPFAHGKHVDTDEARPFRAMYQKSIFVCGESLLKEKWWRISFGMQQKYLLLDSFPLYARFFF